MSLYITLSICVEMEEGIMKKAMFSSGQTNSRVYGRNPAKKKQPRGWAHTLVTMPTDWNDDKGSTPLKLPQALRRRC